MAKLKWSDLSGRQKIGIVIGGVVEVGLLVAALWDIWRRSEDEVRGSRKLWTGISFIDYVGPIAYFVYGRKRS